MRYCRYSNNQSVSVRDLFWLNGGCPIKEICNFVDIRRHLEQNCTSGRALKDGIAKRKVYIDKKTDSLIQLLFI